MDHKYTAIILGKRDIGEADRIYTVYTLEEGKIRAKAVGVRKSQAKLAGHLETATLAEIFVAKSKGSGKITGSIVNNYFSDIKNNLEAISKVFFVFSRLDKIISEQQKDEKVFYLTRDYLEMMEKLSAGAESGGKMKIITLGFLFKLLEEAGYKLETGKCANCESKLQPENNYFSAAKGGFLCAACVSRENKKIKISEDSIKTLRIFSKNKLESLVKLNMPPDIIQNLKIIAQEEFSWITG